MYQVIWQEQAERDLAKIDRTIAERLKKRVETYLINDPINLGEPLFYDWKGHYRYRYGNYRIIYQVRENELLILVVHTGHRKEVY